jgi:putative salt-induced outer membrane protein
MKIYLIATLSAALTSTAFAQENAAPAEKPWKHESQASVVQTTGNSETDSYSVKQSTAYNFDPSILQATASFLKSSGQDSTTGRKNETARKWDAGLRADRVMSPVWNSFLEYKVESDKYAGYQQRHTTSLGAKYYFYKQEKNNVFGELGPAYVHENQVSGNQVHYTSAKVYLEGNYALNDSNSARLWVEYKPNFSDADDYQVDFEGSISSALSTNFALKVAYLSKTDNKPAAAEKTDSTLTTALVAKF